MEKYIRKSEGQLTDYERQKYLEQAAYSRKLFRDTGDPWHEKSMDRALNNSGYPLWISKVSKEERTKLRCKYYLEKAANFHKLFRDTGNPWYEKLMDKALNNADYNFVKISTIVFQNRNILAKNIRWSIIFDQQLYERLLPTVLVSKICTYLDKGNPLEYFELPQTKTQTKYSNQDSNYEISEIIEHLMEADSYFIQLKCDNPNTKLILFRGGRKNKNRAGRGERSLRNGVVQNRIRNSKRDLTASRYRPLIKKR